jgi:hypothetical protein
VAVSFIGGGNRSTQRKPPTCRNSLTNLITKCYIEYTSPWVGFELTPLVVIGTDCTFSCKSNYHTTTTVPSTLRKPNRKRLIDWCLAPTLAIHVFKLCRGVNANGKVVRFNTWIYCMHKKKNSEYIKGCVWSFWYFKSYWTVTIGTTFWRPPYCQQSALSKWLLFNAKCGQHCAMFKLVVVNTFQYKFPWKSINRDKIIEDMVMFQPLSYSRNSYVNRVTITVFITILEQNR